MTELSSDLKRAIQWWQTKHKIDAPKIMYVTDLEDSAVQELKKQYPKGFQGFHFLKRQAQGPLAKYAGSIAISPDSTVSNQIETLFHELWHHALNHHGRKEKMQEFVAESNALNDLDEYKAYVASHFGLKEKNIPIKPDPRVPASVYRRHGYDYGFSSTYLQKKVGNAKHGASRKLS